MIYLDWVLTIIRSWIYSSDLISCWSRTDFRIYLFGLARELYIKKIIRGSQWNRVRERKREKNMKNEEMSIYAFWLTTNEYTYSPSILSLNLFYSKYQLKNFSNEIEWLVEMLCIQIHIRIVWPKIIKGSTKESHKNERNWIMNCHFLFLIHFCYISSVIP